MFIAVSWYNMGSIAQGICGYFFHWQIQTRLTVPKNWRVTCKYLLINERMVHCIAYENPYCLARSLCDLPGKLLGQRMWMLTTRLSIIYNLQLLTTQSWDSDLSLKLWNQDSYETCITWFVVYFLCRIVQIKSDTWVIYLTGYCNPYCKILSVSIWLNSNNYKESFS